MRGAVLYKLGLDFVKERIARRHYGHAWNPNFIQGHHPEFRKFTNVAGWVLCSNAVDYYVKKVCISLLPITIHSFAFSHLRYLDLSDSRIKNSKTEQYSP